MLSFRRTFAYKLLNNSNKKINTHFSNQGINRWSEDLNIEIKHEIENFWKKYISEYRSTSKSLDNFYLLSMFPYPSGKLHMGHVRVYSISDTIARFMKMDGKNVIHPMGWDAFGLPAENAAIERKIQPNLWTENNILKMKQQLSDLGCDFDWDREINTSCPSYYKWTQSIFLELFKAGLAYKRESYVNWDPKDLTVLADEQVDINGYSWRSGAKVEKKLLNQWFIKTTFFAKQLFDGLDDPLLEDWKDVILMQKHWIGECNGIYVDFKLEKENSLNNSESVLRVWMDLPEKILQAKCILISPNNILNSKNYIKSENSLYKALSLNARNPLTGDLLPIYVYENTEYPEGTESCLNCPTVNADDKEIAKLINLSYDEKCQFDNIPKENINIERENICNKARDLGVGGYPVSSKLKDWLISRQRYWGTPIPIINCEKCGPVPVPQEQLPVELPFIHLDKDSDRCQITKADSWLNTICPNCKGKATRETDTMDTFVDSSWYFLRYLDAQNKMQAFDLQKIKDNFPVNLYIGGKEHAVLHLYYARFMTHFLNYIGKVPEKEPFKRLLVQGLVKGKTYKIIETGQYIQESDVKIKNKKKGTAVSISTGKAVEIIWEKMSKSKHNGVDPEDMFRDYGCDTTRLIMLADVAPPSHRNWSNATFPGIIKWQHRLWLTIREFITHRTEALKGNENYNRSDDFEDKEKKLNDSRNYFVSSINYYLRYFYTLSVAISRQQGLTSSLRRSTCDIVAHSKCYERALANQIIMIAPFAPHFASELWSGFLLAPGRLNNECIKWEAGVLEQSWPVLDPHYKLSLSCTVNGSPIEEIFMTSNELNALTDETVKKIIFELEKMKKYIEGDTISYTFNLYPNCKAVFNVLKPNLVI